GDQGLDETWVLYDRMLLDDELYQLWGQFQPDVRIFILSDSCHSGTVARVALYSQLRSIEPLAAHYRGSSNAPPVFRAIPPNVQQVHYGQHAEVYSTRQWAAVKANDASVDASVILISACQDNQLSADGDRNGLFTGILLDVWNNGAFTGTYPAFW